MARRKRSSRQISADLKKLAKTSDHVRNRLGLLHEVQVYQEELIVQNEELARAQAALEETRDRFIELYDFAPNGYLTIDRHGVVLRINLTGAALLGRTRQAIEGVPLLGFVAKDDRPPVLEFLRQCRTNVAGRELVAQFRLKSSVGARTFQIICKSRRSPSSHARRPEYFTALIDITERRQLEAARDRAADEHAALASRLISAQDEERQRIARDLHDNIGQQVTALRLMLQVVAMSNVDDAARARLAQSQAIVEQLDRHLDFLTGELRPASLDLGLQSALEHFVRDWSRTFAIAADVQCRSLERLRLRHDVETHLYRIAQEALNNIYKHAAAAHVTIVLEGEAGFLTMTIKDDGRGFDPDTVAQHGARGLGLVSMRERAQVIGAALDISAAPKRGTTIVVRYRLS